MRDPKQAGETLYPPRLGGWPGAASNPADTRIKDGLDDQHFMCGVEDNKMARPPECFDEWKDKGSHSCKVLSVSEGGVRGRPATCQDMLLHQTSVFLASITTQQSHKHFHQDDDVTKQC